MHLLATTPGTIADGSAAIDLALHGTAFPFVTRPLQCAGTVLRLVHRRLAFARDGRDELGLPHA